MIEPNEKTPDLMRLCYVAAWLPALILKKTNSQISGVYFETHLEDKNFHTLSVIFLVENGNMKRTNMIYKKRNNPLSTSIILISLSTYDTCYSTSVDQTQFCPFAKRTSMLLLL